MAPLLDPEQERELAARIRAGDERAFASLLESHLRLVLAIARELSVYGLPLDELVSEGLLGLCEAARRFDPARGPRLAAYAAVWIRAYMRRYTIAYRRIVRAPSTRHGRKLLSQLRRTQRDLAQANAQAPDAEMLADVLQVDVRDVEEMEAALGARDVAYGDGYGAVELAVPAPSPEHEVAHAQELDQHTRAVARALSGLSARERSIVERRHLGDEAASFATIARELGLSRERVRQIERRAQSKLREAVLS